LNRKVLASASIAAVMTAPVAIAVADTNDTNANTNTDSPASTQQYRELVKQRVRGDRAAERAEARERKAAAKAKAKKRAKKRAKIARKHRAAAAPQAASGQQASGGSVAPANLQAIAACESGGNPSAVGGGGAYRGKYQFDQGTWASVGGSGDPAAASEAEQDQRAAALYARSGASSWPVCGQ
jgi:transglycosylase-like protein